MSFSNYYHWRNIIFPHALIYAVLSTILIGFVILTIIFGSLWLKCDPKSKQNSAVHYTTSISTTLTSTTLISNCSNSSSIVYAVENGIIGFPPRLPDDGEYIQWTFLHMNDVYELLPLDQGRKGGLARVAYMRQLLLEENKNTITVLAGDLVSPSALGTVEVNGTSLHGKQMISTMNTLGLDYMIFGNHEFDLSEEELLLRMNESTFTWINSNVFYRNSTKLFGSSISYKLLTIDGVRILMIGLTINETINYVRIVDQSSLVNYTKQFLTSFSNGTYDVVVAITHLDISADIELARNIPQIDLIIGGHEHENYYELRGDEYTPITKADSNAFTVYIHRCAFNIDKKRFRIYSTLARVSSEVPEEEKTAAVANYWFNLGIQGFQALGYQPLEVLSCLSEGIELDGRFDSVANGATLLTEAICESLLHTTSTYQTTIGLVNAGTIRIDDIMRETVTQYDILRTLPFPNIVVALSVPGEILAQVLKTSMSIKGTSMFIDYTGVDTSDGGSTWFINGTNIATSNLTYKIATTEYVRENTELDNVLVKILQETNITQTKALINYLPIKYPPC